MTQRQMTRRLVRTISLRGAGFLSITGLNAVVSLISVFVVIHVGGASAWGVIATAQTLGAIGAVVTGWGWALYGSVEVARLGDLTAVGRYFFASFAARLALTIAVLPIYGVVTWHLVSGRVGDLAGLLVGAGLLLSGMASPWYFVGTGNPSRLFLFDSLPRLACTAVGIAAILELRDLVAFGALQVIGAASAALATATRARAVTGVRAADMSAKHVLRAVTRMFSGMSVAVASACYAYLPLVIVAAVTPSGLPGFALGDKMQKFAATMMAPLAQTSQSYVPRGSSEELKARVLHVVGVSVLLCLGAGTVFFFSLPLVIYLVTRGGITLGPTMSLGFSLLLVALSLSGTVGIACLVPIGRQRTLVWSSSLGAMVGLPIALAIGLITGSSNGVLWTITATEWAVVSAETVSLISWLRGAARDSAPQAA